MFRVLHLLWYKALFLFVCSCKLVLNLKQLRTQMAYNLPKWVQIMHSKIAYSSKRAPVTKFQIQFTKIVCACVISHWSRLNRTKQIHNEDWDVCNLWFASDNSHETFWKYNHIVLAICNYICLFPCLSVCLCVTYKCTNWPIFAQ